MKYVHIVTHADSTTYFDNMTRQVLSISILINVTNVHYVTLVDNLRHADNVTHIYSILLNRLIMSHMLII